MSFDLARGLRDLSNEPAVPDEAVPLLTVRSRVRRARAVRTAGVGMASAAAAVALGVAVQAAPFQDAPTPPAEQTPVVEPTRTPTTSPTTPAPEPTPEQTPDPTAPPVTTDRPLVALTPEGRLVRLDPDTGEAREEVVSGLGVTPDATVAVAPDGESAYVQIDAADGELPSIIRVSLLDGTTQDVASGWDPAISPDGTTLAFLGPAPGTDPLATRGLTLLDLATQSVRHLPDDEWCGDCERVVTGPTWSPDGRQVAVLRGSTAELSGLQVTVVDVDTAQSVDDGRVVPTQRDAEGSGRVTSPEDQVFLPDGRLAVLLRTMATGADPAVTDAVSVDLLDPATGAVTATIEGPAADGGRLTGAGDGLALVTEHLVPGGQGGPTRLHLWDGTGAFREVGEGLVAVAG